MVRAALLVALVVALVGLVLAEEKYTTKYDNINLDDILSNDRLLNKYTECLKAQDDKDCTNDGKELKKNLPDALENECSKCSEKHKAGAEKVIRYLIDNKAELWKELEAKYDPSGSYRKKYQEEANKRGIKV